MKAVIATYGIPVKAHQPMSFVIEPTDEDEKMEVLLDAIALAKREYVGLITTTKTVIYELQPAVLTVKIYD